MGKLLYGPAQSAIGFSIKISMKGALDFFNTLTFYERFGFDDLSVNHQLKKVATGREILSFCETIFL